MRDDGVHDQPLLASCEAGVIIIEGEAGLLLTMTAEAASSTAETLRREADKSLLVRRQPRR
jgi:hypothetical protein